MNPPVSTQSVLYAVARRMGLVPDENLSPDQAAEILLAMDDRLREGWEMYDFVENTTIEERAFRDDYNSSLCYNAGDIVWDSGSQAYYTANQSGVGGPLSNTTLWTGSSTVAPPAFVPWFQTGKTPIGTAFEAYTGDPYATLNAKKIQFAVSSRGLEFVVTQVPATIWLYFRLPYPGLGQENWDTTINYMTGDQALGSDGHTYVSLSDNNLGVNPLSAGQLAWQKFPVPYVFSRFVITAAFSDTLVVNGQNEKAGIEVQKAYTYLNSEFDKQRLQQSQVERFSVFVS
jgi:hypothetical protein